MRDGLSSTPKSLPPKYFYDARGSMLFEAICDLPEYYLTRAEESLLRLAADSIIDSARPAELLELGSGASRKTRLLLNAMARASLPMRYSPFDVSTHALQEGAQTLLLEYPDLQIDALIGDYEKDLARVPITPHRLVAFLGSTIGNLPPAGTERFLAALRHLLQRGDHLLLGLDLVKPVEIIEAAYNDRAGVTAEFNRNVLRVINRELSAEFDLRRFEHVAFFNAKESQIEMHLRSTGPQTVHVKALDLHVAFADGETVRTEISRKFTRDETVRTLVAAGFTLVRWFENEQHGFALALARADGLAP